MKQSSVGAFIVQDNMYITTNVTTITLPVYLYNNLLFVIISNLKKKLAVDISFCYLQVHFLNEQNVAIDSINLESMRVNSTKQVLFAISNMNPTEVTISEISCDCGDSAALEILSIEDLSLKQIQFIQKRSTQKTSVRNLLN